MMHSHSLESWEHRHVVLGRQHEQNERQTWLVVGLTAATMLVEIVGGAIYGSMAVVADGWHMATHAAALATAALAYRVAHRRADDPRFTFGTGKLGELAGFASAIFLLLVAALIAYESVLRLLDPTPIRFGQALAIAVVGLMVNLASAWLLADHDDDHGSGEHSHHHHDHNLRAAYLHVLADALTSVLAIVALLGAWLVAWVWLDPLMGLVGALVIASWSVSLIRSAGAVLVDAIPDRTLIDTVRQRLEVGGDRVSDLHLWRIGPGHAALVAAIVTDHPQEPAKYKARLEDIDLLSHVTVEVNACPDHAPGRGCGGMN
jgi:cation diffusion facilitator family transporter